MAADVSATVDCHILLMYRNMMPDIRARPGRYYDALLVNEVQDFADHDFNFLPGCSVLRYLYCTAGDFYQHTSHTSRDGNTNATLHDVITRYESRFLAAGVVPGRPALSKTWRCPTSVCRASRHPD
ncbi:hypothetical protein [Pantoea agglomerans]|uniref:hypothetical protein n=1 Tax=Enterobacter agglomerans TaxID=549 RepID=UPI002412FF79|nr:hypothetical protein [Pantoea agglomerans]